MHISMFSKFVQLNESFFFCCAFKEDGRCVKTWADGLLLGIRPLLTGIR